MANEKMIENHKSLLQKLDDFCFGNGSKGVNVRLDVVEDIINGKEECRAMKEIHSHIKQHELVSGRRWEVIIGILLLLIGQVFSLLLISKGLQ